MGTVNNHGVCKTCKFFAFGRPGMALGCCVIEPEPEPTRDDSYSCYKHEDRVMAETCDSCRFWHRIDLGCSVDVGRCIRHPPVLLHGRTFECPSVRADRSACGECIIDDSRSGDRERDNAIYARIEALEKQCGLPDDSVEPNEPTLLERIERLEVR